MRAPPKTPPVRMAPTFSRRAWSARARRHRSNRRDLTPPKRSAHAGDKPCSDRNKKKWRCGARLRRSCGDRIWIWPAAAGLHLSTGAHARCHHTIRQRASPPAVVPASGGQSSSSRVQPARPLAPCGTRTRHFRPCVATTARLSHRRQPATWSAAVHTLRAIDSSAWKGDASARRFPRSTVQASNGRTVSSGELPGECMHPGALG